MKAYIRLNLTILIFGFILLVLILIPTPINATKANSTTDHDFAAHSKTPSCPAGAKSKCIARLVGSVVICTESARTNGYGSVSEYCLSCHAQSHPMAFSHPFQVSYPVDREEFRARQVLAHDIALEAGRVTCRTCHAGLSAANHFLVSHHDSDRICSHCHLTSVDCPTEATPVQTVCYPGRLNGGVRCVTGSDTNVFNNTSEYCADCHGGLRMMARYHPVEVEYPVNRPGFRQVADLDPKVKLDDGMITCESCHAKMSEGMRLCVHCHPK